MSNVDVSTAPSGVLVICEIDARVAPPVPYFDSWWRFGHLSFWSHSYHMWSKKWWDAVQPQWRARRIKAKRAALKKAARDEQEAGKVGSL